MTRRIVHLLSSLEVGGKERVALQLAHRARAEGWDVDLELFDAPYRGEPVDLDPGSLPTHFVPRRAGLDLRLLLALARRWRRGVDLVHAHNDTAVFYAGMAARLLRRGPAVCATFHTKPVHDTPRARSWTRRAARRAQTITAVSDELAATIVRDGWADRCETVWNGVDLDAFAPEGPTGGWRERLSVPPRAILVAQVARLDPVKRHVDLLRAARSLSSADLPVVFALVGEGPLRADLSRQAQDLASVRFVPRVVDMAAFLREVDVLVLCSDHEATPRAVLEAMACARPVLATDVGALREILTCDTGLLAGVLVPARSPEHLAEAVRALAIDPDRRARLGALARARASAFSAEREWSAWSALYESALAARP